MVQSSKKNAVSFADSAQRLSGAGTRENDWLGGRDSDVILGLSCPSPKRRDCNEVHKDSGHIPVKIPVFEKSQMRVGGERQQPQGAKTIGCKNSPKAAKLFKSSQRVQ